MVAADLETNLDSVSSSLVNQVQVTGEGKHVATVGKETSFEVSRSSPLAASSIPFPTEQLCCQLTNHTVFVKIGLNALETRYFIIIYKIIHFLAKINHLTCGG